MKKIWKDWIRFAAPVVLVTGAILVWANYTGKHYCREEAEQIGLDWKWFDRHCYVADSADTRWTPIEFVRIVK